MPRGSRGCGVGPRPNIDPRDPVFEDDEWRKAGMIIETMSMLQREGALQEMPGAIFNPTVEPMAMTGASGQMHLEMDLIQDLDIILLVNLENPPRMDLIDSIMTKDLIETGEHGIMSYIHQMMKH